MTTITLGPEGTFSHEMAIKLGCTDIRFVDTINDIIAAVARGEGDGIAPIENSETGRIKETLDALSRHPVYIVADMYMPIHHHLAAMVPFEEVEIIYAHPQTHEQCSKLIESWKIPVMHTGSNSMSAVKALKNKNAGAIISEFASGIYKLPVIASYIENNPINTTRFVIARRA